jgi:uncharacterized protein involved in type VI secretion and phage assembly
MSEVVSGLYVGTVKDNTLDQDGCIQVNIAALGGVFAARVVAQMAGDQRGFLFLPENNDQVLIAAVEGADVKWAVMGSLWSRKEKPPAPNKDGKNDTKLIKTRGGNIIRLIDTDGNESIEITDKTGKNRIAIETKTNTMTLQSDGSISLKAKSISIEATDGDKIVRGTNVRIN